MKYKVSWNKTSWYTCSYCVPPSFVFFSPFASSNPSFSSSPPSAYLQIPSPQFKLLLDAVVWAFKHTMRNVADIGLNILFTLLQKFAIHEAGAQFFRTYFLDLMQHIFSVVTDTSHTASAYTVQEMFLLKIIRSSSFHIKQLFVVAPRFSKGHEFECTSAVKVSQSTILAHLLYV